MEVKTRTGVCLAIATALMALGPRPGLADQVPPGFSMEKTGSQQDFDYFDGAWQTVQRKLKATGVGSTEWEEFPATLCKQHYLAGMVSVDELYFPSKGYGGLTLRTFDTAKHQWSIYWVNSRTGKLDPIPTVGGFDGKRGEFYASDTVGGKPVKVRYLWLIQDQQHARWEQAFSFDNKTWETNWTADFTRGDTDALCKNGQPIRNQ